MASVHLTGRHRDDRVVVGGVLREVLVVVVGYLAYTWVRKVKTGGSVQGLDNAASLGSFERSLHLTPEHWLNGFFSAHRALATFSGYYYATLHFAVTIGVMIWLFRRRPDHYRLLRTGLVICNYVALVVFLTYPLAPPRLAEHGIDDIVNSAHTWGSLATHQVASAADQYAAMPSLHTAWAMWSGLAIAMLARRWWVRALGVAYPLCTVLVIVGTGNHYVLDAVAGVALILAAMAMSPSAIRVMDSWHVSWLTAWAQVRVRGSMLLAREHRGAMSGSRSDSSELDSRQD